MSLLTPGKVLKYCDKLPTLQEFILVHPFKEFEPILQAQAELTAGEIFREIEKYLLTYSGSIVIKKEQWKVLKERFGVK